MGIPPPKTILGMTIAVSNRIEGGISGTIQARIEDYAVFLYPVSGVGTISDAVNPSFLRTAKGISSSKGTGKGIEGTKRKENESDLSPAEDSRNSIDVETDIFS